MRIIFLATSKIALKVFYSLIEVNDICAVITRPDMPKGRSGKPEPSPMADAAENRGIKTYKPEEIGNDLTEELKSLNADLFVTFAYGKVLKEPFLAITPLGGVNIHPSMLPELRGPSPISSAILAGMKRSGITVQTVRPKVDSGDILFQRGFDILDEDDALTIEQKVSDMAASVINEVISGYSDGRIKPVKQDESKATCCRMIKKEHGLINWNDNGENILNKIRAFVSWPVAYTFLDGKRVNIYRAFLEPLSGMTAAKEGAVIKADMKEGIAVKTNDAVLKIAELQMQGKRRMNWKDFLNGHKDILNKTFAAE